MGKTKLCYYTTGGIMDAKDKYKKELGVENSAFVNMAIHKFLKGEQEINPEFLITKRTDPDYVARSEMDQITITDEVREELNAVAKRYKCSVAIIVFQAVYDFCYELMANDLMVNL